MARKAIPPTTPPAMAPVLELEVDGCGVGVGEVEAVEAEIGLSLLYRSKKGLCRLTINE